MREKGTMGKGNAQAEGIRGQVQASPSVSTLPLCSVVLASLMALPPNITVPMARCAAAETRASMSADVSQGSSEHPVLLSVHERVAG